MRIHHWKHTCREPETSAVLLQLISENSPDRQLSCFIIRSFVVSSAGYDPSISKCKACPGLQSESKHCSGLAWVHYLSGQARKHYLRNKAPSCTLKFRWSHGPGMPSDWQTVQSAHQTLVLLEHKPGSFNAICQSLCIVQLCSELHRRKDAHITHETGSLGTCQLVSQRFCSRWGRASPFD